MKTEQQLDEAIARLNPQIAPTTDLWPAIAQRLENERVAPPTYWRWWGSAAALLIGLTLWQQWPAAQQGNTVVGEWQANHGQTVAMQVQTFFGLQQSQQQLLRAQQLQLQQLKQIPTGFSNWQQQLAIWQQASDHVRLALTADPDNANLIRKLNKIQQQQLNYIQKLVSTSQLT